MEDMQRPRLKPSGVYKFRNSTLLLLLFLINLNGANCSVESFVSSELALKLGIHNGCDLILHECPRTELGRRYQELCPGAGENCLKGFHYHLVERCFEGIDCSPGSFPKVVRIPSQNLLFLKCTICDKDHYQSLSMRSTDQLDEDICIHHEKIPANDIDDNSVGTQKDEKDPIGPAEGMEMPTENSQYSKELKSQRCDFKPEVMPIVCFSVLMEQDQISHEESMCYEWFRLASFKSYNGAASAILLARNGFYHDVGQGPTATRCHFCKLLKIIWEFFDNIEEEHLRLSPNCPLHQAGTPGNVSIDNQHERNAPEVTEEEPVERNTTPEVIETSDHTRNEVTSITENLQGTQIREKIPEEFPQQPTEDRYNHEFTSSSSPRTVSGQEPSRGPPEGTGRAYQQHTGASMGARDSNNTAPNITVTTENGTSSTQRPRTQVAASTPFVTEAGKLRKRNQGNGGFSAGDAFLGFNDPSRVNVLNPKHREYASVDSREASFTGKCPSSLDRTRREMAKAGLFYSVPGRGRGRGKGKGPKRRGKEPTGEASLSIIQTRKERFRERMKTMPREKLEDIILRVLEENPSLILDVSEPAVRHEGGYHPPQGSHSPDWCICGRCREMPTQTERICCEKSPRDCISQLPDFAVLVLDPAVLALARLQRRDILLLDDADNEDQHKANRHAAYRQYVLWAHGRLGVGNRRVIPSCCVWAIRDKFPNPFNNYVGFMPARLV